MKKKYSKLAQQLLSHIRAEGLVRAGERVGVAVSGGADSVALLQLLLELRQELGIVLAVAHFDHQIRGKQSRGDAEFVEALGKKHGLEVLGSVRDTPSYARDHKLTLEEAARDLRYNCFESLLDSKQLDKIATGHTLDDQAETVLMRLLRGAGTRGLAGILPQIRGTNESEGVIMRPLLPFQRAQFRTYLRSIRQDWREDKSNLDTRHFRNRVRHKLLPLLERDFNPRIKELLAHTAEIARVEDEFWYAQVIRAHHERIYNIASGCIDVEALLRQPTALQRRLLFEATLSAIGKMDFGHLERLRSLFQQKATASPKRLQLRGGEARLIKNKQGKAEVWLLPGGRELKATFWPPLSAKNLAQTTKALGLSQEVTNKLRSALKSKGQDTIAAEEKA